MVELVIVFESNLKSLAVMKSFLLFLLFTVTPFAIFSQSLVLPLWDGIPPHQDDVNLEEERNREEILRIGNVQAPTMEVYLPDETNTTGKAVVIFPGGG